MSIPTGLVVLQQVSAQDTAIALAQAASAASHHLMRYGCASCSQITAEHGLRMCSARTFGTGILGSGTGPNTKAIVAVSGGDARRPRAISVQGAGVPCCGHGGWGRGPSRVCGLHGCATVLSRGYQHLWCWDGLSGALGRMRRRVAASVTKSDTRSRIRCANGAMCDRETGSRCEVSRADRNCKLCMVWI